jgi:mannose-6-phosphate isomerase-like protein (cupin superfamily)
MPTAAKIVAPGQGTVLHVIGGDMVTVKARAEDTGGAYTLFETIVPPQGGPLRHVHHREDEAFYVVEGQFTFTIGDQDVQAGPGFFLWGPRDIPHSFRNTAAEPGKLLITISPGGFERFMEEFASFDPNAPPDFAKIVAVGQKYGLEFV